MKMGMKAVLLAAVAFGTASQVQAALVNLGPGSFTPLATAITFSEFPVNTANPSYSFTGLPGLGNVNVNFGGFFNGQTHTGAFPDTLGVHTPTVGPALALDPAAPATFITTDISNPSSPVLSGTPTFNGPISVLFSTPVAGVGLSGGFFDAVNSTTIEAYDATGNVLGSITNSVTGIEFYGLADSSGANVIAGISFFITGNEPAGFAIDDLTFGAAAQIVGLAAPLPAAFWPGLALMGCLGATKLVRRVRTA